MSSRVDRPLVSLGLAGPISEVVSPDRLVLVACVPSLNLRLTSLPLKLTPQHPLSPPLSTP